MKTIALAITLMLHVTGLWTHLPASTRNHLTAADTGATAAATFAAGIHLTPVSSLALPVQTGTEPLTIPATAAYAADLTTGTPLYQQASTKRLPIASVTKMITCLVILSRHSVEEKVTVPKLPAYEPADETLGLRTGETYRLGDLVTAALVPSDNDAADTLALYDVGSIAKFTARMNAKMAQWGIPDTHFASASGLQDTGNFASAASLAKIAGLALANPDIRGIIKLTNATISSTAGRVFNLTSTNELLAGGQFYGIKTGYTQAAGECFVGLARINGHEVVTVVLGAEDRFGATQTLANWISHNWQWL
jgi:D-alanyl-D-alanine carboxypeptidase (penicillin-binding protein 5/6)